MNECFVIFEGGGAKGITHLGALKALQDVDVARIGAAGTSAGAIIAALTAVGYAPDELFTENGDNILARRGLTPVALLGETNWRQFARLRNRDTPSAGDQEDARPPGQRTVVTTRLKIGFWLMSLCSAAVFYVFCLARTSGWPLVAGVIWKIIDLFGFFSTDPARAILNDLLLAKVREQGDSPARDLVCFRDIEPRPDRPYCLLKLITTNLGTKGLEMFDGATPDVVVADAVAASFSIPFFFKPTSIRTVSPDGSAIETLPDEYVDGGLVSNLPVWVFNEVKKSIERLPRFSDERPLQIVAFNLKDVPKARGKPDQHPLALLGNYAANVLHTGISGGQSVVQTIVTHLTIVPLSTPLTTVQFDCTKSQAIEAYLLGRADAKAALEALFVTHPRKRREIMEAILAMAAEHRRRILGAEADRRNFRCCLVRELGNRSFKVVFGVNMSGDADDDLVLDALNPGAPTAFRDRDFTLVDVRSSKATARMTKYERAMLRQSLVGAISVPIFAKKADWAAPSRPEPVGVFCIDSDFDLSREYADQAFLRMLAEECVALAPYIPAY